jgi:hypothetical protein
MRSDAEIKVHRFLFRNGLVVQASNIDISYRHVYHIHLLCETFDFMKKSLTKM